MRGSNTPPMLDHCVDQRFLHLSEEVRLPIITPPERLAGVEHGLMRNKRFCRDGIGGGRPKVLERMHRILTGSRAARPASGDCYDRFSMQFLWQERCGRCQTQNKQTTQLVRGRASYVVIMLRNLACMPHRVHDHTAKGLRSMPVRFELERH